MSGNNPTISSKALLIPVDKIDKICRRYHVRSLRIFGSVARGTAKRSSDVDILVEFAEPVSLLALFAYNGN